MRTLKYVKQLIHLMSYVKAILLYWDKKFLIVKESCTSIVVYYTLFYLLF